MVFNATLNNISLISLWSVLFLEETEDPGKATDLPRITDKLYHIMLYTVPDLPISSIGSQILGGLRPRCIIYLTLLLMDFHTYVVIMYTALSKQPFSNFLFICSVSYW